MDRSRRPRWSMATALLLLGAGCSPAGDDDDSTLDGGPVAFSLAILTDTHVGEGQLDHGEPGFDDSGGGGDDPITARLAAAVEKINVAVDEHDIRLVMALGDFTDSAERSELVRARELLDELTVPYVPLIGNHDMWPYAWIDGDSYEEATEATGDDLFDEVFADHFAALGGQLERFDKAPVPVEGPDGSGDWYPVNVAFDVEGMHLVGLDLGTREAAPPGLPGVGPEADLHDFPGGSWPWFTEHLQGYPDLGDRNVLVFAHHPPLPLGLDSLAPDEFDTMEAFIHGLGSGDHVFGFFAGHWHMDLVSDLYGAEPVVVTGATKQDESVRLVRIGADGLVDYETKL
jgi:hypothetical protein